MIIDIVSSLRWIGSLPIEVYIGIYTTDQWFSGSNPSKREVIKLKDWGDTLTLANIISDVDIDYIIIRVQSLIDRRGQHFSVDFGDNIVIGVLDDVLNENDNEIFNFINQCGIDYLVFTVNRNQIPKYKLHTNTHCYFLPIPFATPDSHMRLTKDWSNRYPAVAYSGNLQSPHRTEVGSALLRHNVPATIINHNGLSINPGLVSAFYKGNPPKNFGHFNIMLNYVYGSYSTHFGAINTPRWPMDLSTKDPGHFVYRITEIIGSRCLLFQRKIPQDSGLYDIFSPNIHFVEWENCEELVDRIIFYIKNRERAEKIAEQGFQQMKQSIFTNVIRKRWHDFITKNTQLPGFAIYENN